MNTVNEPVFRWLHLTDLHVGQKTTAALWPDIKTRVHDDLRRFLGPAKPVHAVFFTGDLTQKAGEQEFTQVGGYLLGLQSALEQWFGHRPAVIVVPGNHDLRRPDESAQAVDPALLALRGWATNPHLRDAFWSPAGVGVRKPVVDAFSGWSSFIAKHPSLNELGDSRVGLLPGELAGTIVVGGLKIGVIGLNTAAFQLDDGDYRGRLSLHPQQKASLFSEGVLAWSREHHACFLLTHHPPSWLDNESRTLLATEIAPSDAVQFHLCGHQHQPEDLECAEFGLKRSRLILGRALFGLEKWGSPPASERLHGYSVGVLRFGERRRARLWPRAAVSRGGSGLLELDRDQKWPLAADGGTEDETDFGPAPMDVVPLVKVATPVLHGWIELTVDVLSRLQAPLGPAELRLYFDGQEPDWRHALAKREIPRRGVVSNAVAKLQSGEGQTAVMLLTAGGEGKSTVLRQVAVDLLEGGCRVLVRDVVGEPRLDAQQVVELPVGHRWVLVTDDADQVASEIQSAVRAVKDSGRTDIHWLFGARDTDWNARWRIRRESTEPQWTRFADVWPRVQERSAAMRMTESDAQAIVTAWEAAGALGSLAGVAEGERANELLRSSRSTAGLGNETLFGAVLEKRVGADGLPAHVQTLLERLGDQFHRIGGNGSSLRDAFLYAAACDAVGVDGIDLNVVADLTGVPRNRRRPEILIPLGAEAAGAGGGSALRTRHTAIAATALSLVGDGRVLEDLTEIYRAIVRGTVGAARDGLRVHSTHGAIMNIGPTLLKRLPRIGVDQERAKEIALAAAEAAETADPDLLVLTVTRAKTLRDAGDPDTASEVLRGALNNAPSRKDFGRVGRGYLFELSVAEGNAGRHIENLWLAGACISDARLLGTLTRKDARLALAGMGAACMKMDGLNEHPAFQHVLAATAVLGPTVLEQRDQRGANYFRRYADAARAAGIPTPDAVRALAWLADGLPSAESAMADGQFVGLRVALFGSGGRGFSNLRRLLRV